MSLPDIIVLTTSIGLTLLFAVLIRFLFRRGKAYNEIFRLWPANVDHSDDYRVKGGPPRRQFLDLGNLPGDIAKRDTKVVPVVPTNQPGQKPTHKLLDYARRSARLPAVNIPAASRVIPPGQRITKGHVPVPNDAPRAHFSRARWVVTAVITLAALIWWTFFRLQLVLQSGVLGEFRYAYWFIFVILVIQVTLAYAEQPRKGRDTSGSGIVTGVIVSTYNEHPGTLANCLYSQFYQSSPPDFVSVTDDGSTEVDYTGLRHTFEDIARRSGIVFVWKTEKKNKGKRHGQIAALRHAISSQKYDPKKLVAITIDSDCIYDVNALREVVRPLSNPKIHSVAGIVLALNNSVNMFARFTDVLFVVQQLIDRSAMSTVGNVLVNSGGLAAYRANVLLDNVLAYLNETFGPMPVPFSDDSFLCLMALKRGMTVQQPSAITFTEMPENFDHHRRQQFRWFKGSFIRSWWRLKYLPVLSWGYARQFFGWAQTIMATEIAVTLLVIDPLLLHKTVP